MTRLLRLWLTPPVLALLANVALWAVMWGAW